MIDDESQHKEPDCDNEPTGNEIYKSEHRNPATNKHEKSADPPGWSGWYRNPEYVFACSIAVFTLVLTGSAIYQAVVMERQWETMEKTLVASQRPWVSVEYALVSDLKLSGGEGRLVVRYKTKNHGPTPAVGIGIDAVFDIASPHHSDILAEQGKVCARGRLNLSPGEFSAGDTLFPDQERQWESSIPISRADMERSWSDVAETHKMKPDTIILPVLVGCVSYRFTFDGSIHKTRFMASLSRRDPNRPNARVGIETSHGDVPLALLALDDVGFMYGGSFAD